MNKLHRWSEILRDSDISGRLYRDEPILRTAAAMQRDLPEPYRQMRRLALQNGTYGRSVEEIFYRQGKFMEEYEDSFPQETEFFRYFPTYQSMSDLQLRVYFTWRTRMRHGDLRRTSLSFVFIYMYELINGIGCTDAQDGFNKLRDFCAAYIPIDRGIERYANLWLRDYVLYYGLDISLLEPYMDLKAEQAYLILRDAADAPEKALFDALCECSSYNLRHSRFYREHAADMERITCAAYRAYADYYAKNRKFDLFTSMIGRPYTTRYIPFSSAVFFEKREHPDVQISPGAFTSFCCRDGCWTYTRLWSSTNSARQIGALLKTVDAVMRQRWAYPHPLKSANLPKYLQRIVEETVDADRADAAKRAARAVTIDFGKLQGIREAADATRDKLIVEEEPEDELPPLPEPQAVSAPPAERPFGLDGTEYAVLCALLSGGDAEAPARQAGLPLSVVADGINEKCFDMFADTVLVIDADGVSVLDDYAGELKGLLL